MLRSGAIGCTRSSTSLMVRRQGARIRLFTRRGYDWSHRFPLIVEAAGALRVSSISIDGENLAAPAGTRGIAIETLRAPHWWCLNPRVSARQCRGAGAIFALPRPPWLAPPTPLPASAWTPASRRLAGVLLWEMPPLTQRRSPERVSGRAAGQWWARPGTHPRPS